MCRAFRCHRASKTLLQERHRKCGAHRVPLESLCAQRSHMGLSLSECSEAFVKSGYLSLWGKGFKGCPHLSGTRVGAPSSFPSWVYPPVHLFGAAFGILRTPCLRGGKSGRNFLLFYLMELLQMGRMGAHGYKEETRKKDGDSYFWQQKPILAFCQFESAPPFPPLEGFGALSSRSAGCFQHLLPRYDVGGYLSSPSAWLIPPVDLLTKLCSAGWVSFEDGVELYLTTKIAVMYIGTFLKATANFEYPTPDEHLWKSWCNPVQKEVR